MKGNEAKSGTNAVQSIDMGLVFTYFDGGVLGEWTSHTVLTPLFPRANSPFLTISSV